MKYKVEFSDKALKFLKKTDKSTAKILLSWITKNLQDCENPRVHGTGLTSNRIGQWRYRVGDYRIIADIQEEKVIILILEIGHRRNIYEL